MYKIHYDSQILYQLLSWDFAVSFGEHTLSAIVKKISEHKHAHVKVVFSHPPMLAKTLNNIQGLYFSFSIITG